MKQATWRVGWYSKVILTIIAASLVGLLIRELPSRIEAKTEQVVPLIPEAAEEFIETLPEEEREVYREAYIKDFVERTRHKGTHPYFLSLRDEDINEAMEWSVVGTTYLRLKDASRYRRVNALLDSLYSKKFRVKFVTNDFIILEQG